ncbi:MAG: hypothetical protein MR688_01105 [Prevotella sp.]|nr:hypothetical protein [Prevotella sp.]
MKQKIFLLFAMFVGFAMQTLATAATPDSVFVVKNGRIVSAYEVGTDVDNISFPKRIQLDGNCVKVGDDVVEMKSAVVTTVNNYKYIYLSTLEGCKTPEDVMKGGKNLQLAFSPTLLDKYVEFNAFGHDFDADKDFFQAVFIDVDEYNRNDDYEPVSVSSYDWNDYYSDGLLQMSFAGGKLALNLEATPKKGETLLAAQYNGAYTEVVANENHFIVDGKRYEMRAAFAEKKADGVNFYLTPGNIGSANELDNCYYYVRLFVPQSNMDGSELDVQGNKKYELTFVDNVTDVNNPQTFSISNDAPSSATGTISVLDNGDGTYTIKSKASSIKSARMLVMKENDWDDALNAYDVETPTMAWADFMATTDKAEDVTEVVKQFNGKFTFKKSFSDAERGWYVAVLAVTDEYGTTVSRSTFHSYITDAEFGTLTKTFPVE